MLQLAEINGHNRGRINQHTPKPQMATKILIKCKKVTQHSFDPRSLHVEWHDQETFKIDSWASWYWILSSLLMAWDFWSISNSIREYLTIFGLVTSPLSPKRWWWRSPTQDYKMRRGWLKFAWFCNTIGRHPHLHTSCVPCGTWYRTQNE